jgi:DNA primase
VEVEELLINKKIDFIPKGGDLVVRCLSPEHEDSTPSMRIDKITGIYGCFSCGFKGNIFAYFGEKGNFLQIRKDLLKQKIANKIRENVGLNIPQDATPYEGSWRGISNETYKKFGAFEHYDKEFVGRITFPLKSMSDRIVAFCSRATSPETTPRYLISPHKAKLPVFPALPSTIKGRVILVEGIFDMLNLYDKGLTNVFCIFGTNQLNKEKLYGLKIQGIKGIDIMMDGDEAGKLAAEKIKELVESVEIHTRTITLPDGKDPGELTAKQVISLRRTLYEQDSAD